jgi:glycosyltransferase involved in cell wall biosynthesis
MISHPLVSVIIPAYKARNFLAQALQSVADQDYPNIEILVIDDASPEPIDDIISAYQNIPSNPILHLISHFQNQGLGAARNTGINNAKGEFVALLDHDDLWKKNHLTDLIPKMQGTNADIGFCKALLFTDNPNDHSGTWGPPNEAVETHPGYDLFKCSYITPSSAIIRTSAILKLNGFNTDPKVHMCEDHDLWLRAAIDGFQFYYSKETTIYYRKHSEQATSKKGYMAFQSAYVLHLHADKIKAPWFEKRAFVAHAWWSAFNTLATTDRIRPDVLIKAIRTSLPVPWEAARGLVHLARNYRQTRN